MAGSAMVLGAGPVGRAVAEALVAGGDEPVVVTRSGSHVPGSAAAIADVADPALCEAVIREHRPSAVFQCAQPPYHRWVDEFPPLQRSVLDACRQHGATLVAVENLYGYGPVAAPMTETTPMRPHTRKGRVRAAMWEELLAAHSNGHVPTVAVRASDFFGVGVRESAFGERFFGRLAKGKKAQVLGSSNTRHSATFIPDLAQALVAVAADESSWGRAWHAPTAPAVTQGEMVEMAAHALIVEPRMTEVSPLTLRLAGLFSPGARETVEMMYEFAEDFIVDSSDFVGHFGVEATPLDEAIAATANSYRMSV